MVTVEGDAETIEVKVPPEKVRANQSGAPSSPLNSAQRSMLIVKVPSRLSTTELITVDASSQAKELNPMNKANKSVIVDFIALLFSVSNDLKNYLALSGLPKIYSFDQNCSLQHNNGEIKFSFKRIN